VAEWSVGQKRQVVARLVEHEQMGVMAACSLVGLNRSTYYMVSRKSRKKKETEIALATIVQKQAGKHPRFGYRRIAHLVRKTKRFAHVGDKSVRRTMQTLGLAIKRKRKPRRTTNSQHEHPRYPNLVMDLMIDHPNQVWVGDIACVLLGDGSEVFVAMLMDRFTRIVRGWELARDLTHHLPLSALKKALRKGCPEIHHSDQGVQYATPKYTQSLLDRGIRISMAEVGQAWQTPDGRGLMDMRKGGYAPYARRKYR